MKSSARALVRALVALLAAATPTVAATPYWATTFDAGRTATASVPPAGAGLGHFAGGTSTYPPVYRANNQAIGAASQGSKALHPAFTPALPWGLRAWLDFDSTAAGGDRFATVLLGSGQSAVSVGALTLPVLAPYGTCVGGSRKGQSCLLGGTAAYHKCPSGACQTPRAPALAMQDSGGKTGCALYISQTCSDVDLAGTCTNPILALDTLYGSPQDGFRGRCGASKTMTDTVCGGVCATASDCLQGRPTETGATATQCVNDATAATCAGKVCVGGTNDGASCSNSSACPSGTCGGCHCINECDEQNANEATCEERLFASIARAPRQNYAVVLEQENGTGTAICRFAGGVLTSLCEGGSNAGGVCASNGDCPSAGVCKADRMQVFHRGIETPQKLGVCTSGTALTDGGRNGTACGTNADCACNTAWPTYNAGTCTAGTCTTTGGTPETPVTSPDRVVFGWADGASRVARFGVAAAKIETGTGATLNWRTETTLANAEGGTLTQQWTSANCTNDTCLTGAGDATTEPDDIFSLSSNYTRLVHSGSSNFVHEWTWGDIATTSDTPIAVTMDVSAIDAESADNDAAGVKLGLRRATGSTALGASFDLASLEAMKVCTDTGGVCSVDADCANNTCVASDGSTRGRAYPTRALTLTKDPADGTSALTRTVINGLIGQITKETPHGAAKEARVTFGALESFLATVAPLSPDVLPGGKVVSFCCDSLTNDPLFYANYTGLVTEPNRIYDAATGGRALGNALHDAASILGGTSGSTMSTVSVVGATGQKVDVLFIYGSANTLHPTNMGNPAQPTLYSGLNQAGWCECWSSGGGYCAQQGKPCGCAESSGWAPATVFEAGRCLIKNANFGSRTTCTCTPGSTTECELGGTAPGSPGTKTSATCCSSKSSTCTGSGVCPNNGTGYTPTAAAGTVGMAPPGCPDSPDCPGVCVATPTIADMIDAKRRLDALAAANGTTNVWVTQPPPSGYTTSTGRSGWYEGAPAVAGWDATLLAEQKAINGPFLDLGQYLYDTCGPNLLVKDGVTACIKDDGIHLTPFGNQLYAELAAACTANTTLAGQVNRTTDGVCTSGPLCTSGTCASGLRKGIACGANADCAYCSDGALGKLGRKCDADADCGYYSCAFP